MKIYLIVQTRVLTTDVKPYIIVFIPNLLCLNINKKAVKMPCCSYLELPTNKHD